MQLNIFTFYQCNPGHKAQALNLLSFQVKAQVRKATEQTTDVVIVLECLLHHKGGLGKTCPDDESSRAHKSDDKQIRSKHLSSSCNRSGHGEYKKVTLHLKHIQ
jgi:hypothetical protein